MHSSRYADVTSSADRGVQNVDREIVPVSRIFELQGVAEMKRREKRYLR